MTDILTMTDTVEYQLVDGKKVSFCKKPKLIYTYEINADDWKIIWDQIPDCTWGKAMEFSSNILNNNIIE